MAGSGCNAYQIRKIYAIGGALGMVKRNEEDDLLHELVEGMTGKKSIKALTYGEACKVIGELEGRQGTPPPRKSGKPLRKTAPGHTSEGQRRKVWALMYRLQDASPSKAPLGDRLCAIIKKELGMDAFPKDPFAWISYKDGNKLVEVFGLVVGWLIAEVLEDQVIAGDAAADVVVATPVPVIWADEPFDSGGEDHDRVCRPVR